MGELLAVTCDCCGEPMLPNISTLDEDGCGWTCINPACLECRADELEAEDLIECGVPEYLAVRLARLIDFYEDQRYEDQRGREAGCGSCGRAAVHSGGSPVRCGGRERSMGAHATDGGAAGLGRERRLLAALGARLGVACAACRDAGELAAALDRRLVVSYASNEFEDGQAAKQTLAVLAQLTSTIESALADAQGCFEEIDRSALIGLRTDDDL